MTTTWAPWSTANLSPAAVSTAFPSPSQSRTRTGMIVAPGATPFRSLAVVGRLGDDGRGVRSGGRPAGVPAQVVVGVAVVVDEVVFGDEARAGEAGQLPVHVPPVVVVLECNARVEHGDGSPAPWTHPRLLEPGGAPGSPGWERAGRSEAAVCIANGAGDARLRHNLCLARVSCVFGVSWTASARRPLELLLDRSSNPGTHRAIVGLGTTLHFDQRLLGKANGDHLGQRRLPATGRPCGAWFSAST